MIRRSLFLPEALDQRLLIASKQMGKSVSDLARELLDQALSRQEAVRLERLYDGLLELRGIGRKGITDASTTIDETLYGESGAWRGEPGEQASWQTPKLASDDGK